MDEEKTILSLNDDCLLLIVSLLHKSEQINLKRVCTRFAQVIDSYWSVKYKKRIRTPSRYDYTRKWFGFLAFHLRPFVQVLELGALQQHECDIIRNSVFPQTHTLGVSLEYIAQADRTHTLMHVFPNLKTLDLLANIDLETIANMQNITELQIEYTKYEGVLYFEPIFTNLKLKKFAFGYCDRSKVMYDVKDFETILQCETLEELTLNAIFLDFIVTKLNQLPKLRSVCCYAYTCHDTIERNIFQKTIDVFGARTLALNSNNIFYNFPMHYLSKMPNLRKWTMRDSRVSTFEPQQLDMKHLKELYIFGTKVLEASQYECEVLRIGCKDFKSIDVIAACKNLEILGIPRIWVNSLVHLDELCAIFGNQKHRKRPLHLKCFDYLIDTNLPHVSEDDIEHLMHKYHGILYITNEEFFREDDYGRFKSSYNIFQIDLHPM